MGIVCNEIPITDQVKKALHGNNPALLRVQRIDAVKIPELNVEKSHPYVLPVWYRQIAEKIESLPIRGDDVFVASFPKSGTTWTQEMVWLIANNLDFNKAKQLAMIQRYAFLEISGISETVQHRLTVDRLAAMASPRFIKTHLPVGLLPNEFWSIKPKLIYVARNSKDAAISYYHHYRNVMGYKGTLEEFLDSFLNDLVIYSSIHDHVLDYWRLRNLPNILFITYEEMSTNLVGVIEKVSNFFGAQYSAHKIDELVKHLAFDEMKNNKKTNYEEVVQEAAEFYGNHQLESKFKFLRRGQINSYVDEMPVHYQQKFDEWTETRLKGTGFSFNF